MENVNLEQSKELPKVEKKWSRQAKREGQRLNLFLMKLIHAFMYFRQQQEDKNGQEVVNKFSELELQWLKACNMKWKNITPKRTAFNIEVNSRITRENEITRQRNESALKAREEIKTEAI